MSVYVDDMRVPFGRMLMCHMIADSPEELLEIADRIGVRRKWLQRPGTYREHFDICAAKRVLAINAGAVEISQKQLGRKLLARRPYSGLALREEWRLR